MSPSESTVTADLRTELLARADALRAAAPGSDAADAALASLVETAVIAFADSVRERGIVPLPADHRLTATDAATVCSQLLEATDLQVFELGLWRSWVGTSGGAGIDPRDMKGTLR